MQIARYEAITEVEGPGKRAVVWLQGCSIKCSECCNPELIDVGLGYFQDPVVLAEKIAKNTEIEGVTILGGEPLDQPKELFQFVETLKNNSKHSILLFSGYTWDMISSSEKKMQIVENCDLVIAGPFIKSETPDNRRWVGSRNQTIHYISNRYGYLKNNWELNVNEVEFVIRDEEILVNGTPIDFSEDNFGELFKGGR